MGTGKQVQLTKDGLESLKKELDSLVNNKRPKLVDRLSNARTQGDLMENSDYHNAKDELEFLDGRIDELQEVLKNAVVLNGAKNGGVSVGTKVTIKVNSQTHDYFIVGEWEADPMKKRFHTYLAKLYGKKSVRRLFQPLRQKLC
jgi:transcription elongation factor GreA